MLYIFQINLFKYFNVLIMLFLSIYQLVGGSIMSQRLLIDQCLFSGRGICKLRPLLLRGCTASVFVLCVERRLCDCFCSFTLNIDIVYIDGEISSMSKRKAPQETLNEGITDFLIGECDSWG